MAFHDYSIFRSLLNTLIGWRWICKFVGETILLTSFLWGLNTAVFSKASCWCDPFQPFCCWMVMNYLSIDILLLLCCRSFFGVARRWIDDSAPQRSYSQQTLRHPRSLHVLFDRSQGLSPSSLLELALKTYHFIWNIKLVSPSRTFDPPIFLRTGPTDAQMFCWFVLNSIKLVNFTPQ